MRSRLSYFFWVATAFVMLGLQSAAIASSWDLMPGWAVDVGDGWVIGHAQAGGGNQIFRWNGQGWDLMPGGAVGIGGTFSVPWIVNNSKQIFRWNK
jgi:hypothetical protein